MKIRTLIVDDEPYAREQMRWLLRDDSDIEFIGESGNGAEAISIIKDARPDLIFLDIQMPGMSGFDVLQEIIQHYTPSFIFVTAYDKYAIKAFDVHALDYLLKPVTSERLNQAMRQVREQMHKIDLIKQNKSFLSVLTELSKRKNYLEKLVVKSDESLIFLKIKQIDWFEAFGNYVKVHVGKQIYILRSTMNRMEAKLDPNQFIRIHRSVIVNSDCIKGLFPLNTGDTILVLKDNTKLTLSRHYRNRIFQ